MCWLGSTIPTLVAKIAFLYRSSTIRIDPEYENQRWLPNQPVVYIGKTDQALSSRIESFTVTSAEPDRLMLGSDCEAAKVSFLVYWSPAEKPYGPNKR
jgi:hypothetical protein